MRLLTVKELSEIIKVKESTLYAWAKRGSIPCHKLNGLLRFDIEEIEEWVKYSKIRIQKIPPMPIKKGKSSDINPMVRNAIDSEKGKTYNRASRKPGIGQGPRKEV